MRNAPLLGVILHTLSACGGKSNDTTSAVDSAQAAAYCQAIVDHYAACGSVRESGYCDNYVQCIESVYRQDVLAALTECEQNLACGESSSACIEAVSSSNTGSVFAEYKSACEARQVACESEIITDYRFFCSEDELGACNDTFIRETEDCLKQDCNSIRGCMDRVSARHRCKG